MDIQYTILIPQYFACIIKNHRLFFLKKIIMPHLIIKRRASPRIQHNAIKIIKKKINYI